MNLVPASRWLALAAIVLAGCASSAPNADGWWDPGVHAVDGYWVTEESPCEPANDQGCAAAAKEAEATVLAADPDAAVTRVIAAGWPARRGDNADEVTMNLAGLQQPRFIILDLADGSRRTIGMNCGPEIVDGAYPVEVCHAAEFDLWRVRGS